MYLIFPWKKITILYFNYAWFLLFVFIFSAIIILKSSSRTIFSKSSANDKKVAFILFSIFGLLAVFSISSSPGSTKSLAELDYPFRRGEFLIVHGGNNPLVNYHYLYYSQKYALDITKNCSKEMNFLAKISTNEDFCIWNEPLVAVCDGFVSDAVDSFKDNIPSEMDRKNYRGNYVLLHCRSGVNVLYAHLRSGSLLVKKGEVILRGKQIGNVGNSGNSSEPHLHIQANLKKEPVIIKFNGRSYKRNDVIRI